MTGLTNGLHLRHHGHQRPGHRSFLQRLEPGHADGGSRRTEPGNSYEVDGPPGGNGELDGAFLGAGSPITGYVAKASGPSGRACTTTGATSCIVTGLVNGAEYTFSVVATNAMGAGPASSPSNQVRTGR
ncbi:MAG: fibronectin type III domain-containing protein [Acidimicrobiales bacterium]